MLGDQGIATVRPHQIPRPHGELSTRQPVEHHRRHPIRILHMAAVFARHPRLRSPRAGGLEQQRLHEGLRQVVHPGRRRQQVLGLTVRCHAPACHPAQLFADQTFAEHVFAHQLLVGGVHVGLMLDLGAKIAQNLHRALVGDMRARAVGEPAIAVDRHVFNAIARQQGRRGRPRRPGAHDEDVGGDIGQDQVSPLVAANFPPASRRRIGNSCMPVLSENSPHSPRGAKSMMMIPRPPSAIR